MTKFIIRCAKNPNGKEFIDLEFNIRPGSYSSKWIECIKSVQDRPPHQYGFPKWTERDPKILIERIREAIYSNVELKLFVLEKGFSLDQSISTTLINCIHRYLEENQVNVDYLLNLHNDIHYLESVWEDTKELLKHKLKFVPKSLMENIKLSIKITVDEFLKEYQSKNIEQNIYNITNDINVLEDCRQELYTDALPNAGIFKKLQWIPPGKMIDMTQDDYKEFTTEPCWNFIQDDFNHVGRSPHNSFSYQDDTSLYSSCVIQHKVGSGIKWFIPDDSHLYNDKKTFQDWVSQHQDFFKSRWGIETNDDPRLCFGRIIIATGCDDYSRIDRSYDYVVRAFIAE